MVALSFFAHIWKSTVRTVLKINTATCTFGIKPFPATTRYTGPNYQTIYIYIFKTEKKPTFSGNKHILLQKVSSTEKAESIFDSTNVFTKISFLLKAIWSFLMATESRILYSTTAFLKESLFMLLHWQSYVVFNQNDTQFATTITTIFSY